MSEIDINDTFVPTKSEEQKYTVTIPAIEYNRLVAIEKQYRAYRNSIRKMLGDHVVKINNIDSSIF